jgi:hypothetical protein
MIKNSVQLNRALLAYLRLDESTDVIKEHMRIVLCEFMDVVVGMNCPMTLKEILEQLSGKIDPRDSESILTAKKWSSEDFLGSMNGVEGIKKGEKTIVPTSTLVKSFTFVERLVASLMTTSGDWRSGVEDAGGFREHELKTVITQDYGMFSRPEREFKPDAAIAELALKIREHAKDNDVDFSECASSLSKALGLEDEFGSPEARYATLSKMLSRGMTAVEYSRAVSGHKIGMLRQPTHLEHVMITTGKMTRPPEDHVSSLPSERSEGSTQPLSESSSDAKDGAAADEKVVLASPAKNDEVEAKSDAAPEFRSNTGYASRFKWRADAVFFEKWLASFGTRAVTSKQLVVLIEDEGERNDPRIGQSIGRIMAGLARDHKKVLPTHRVVPVTNEGYRIRFALRPVAS